MNQPRGKANNVHSWSALLEACLPAHLRAARGSDSVPNIQSVEEKAEILLASYGSPNDDAGVDLLAELGVNQGRWTAAVTLIRELVEYHGPAVLADAAPLPAQNLWSSFGLLSDLTVKPVALDRPEKAITATATPTTLQTKLPLDDETASSQTGFNRHRDIPRDVLGVIWRSLGSMIIACSDGTITPEILEIIAYLHHQGMMPASIYSRKSQEDPTAIQQPPTLHLLSSRILTSLSDAAWRAHEKVIVEEAKSKGGDYLALHPEIPGTAYRVHVAGLRPEIWLELVLWACLHGGWVLEGNAILRAVIQQSKPEWRPISWRHLVPSELGRSADWDQLGYIFNTRSPGTMDQLDTQVDVRHTVSSEVVNAYVDVLLSQEHEPWHRDRPLSLVFILSQLNSMRSFLERSQLKLSGGSWDAIVLRLYESRPELVERVDELRQLIRLSPKFGGEVSSSNTQNLPPYVLDASAAILGIGHENLRLQIRRGNLEGALKSLKYLRNYTDENKRTSLELFLGEIKCHQKPKKGGLFTSNYAAIEYPAYEPQIPPLLLGALLGLATDASRPEVGAWLLRDDGIEEPIIKESMYADPAITPALVRFATAGNDRALLSRIVKMQKGVDGAATALPHEVLRAFFDTQVSLHNWTAARQILAVLKEEYGSSRQDVNLRSVAREMILLYNRQTSKDRDSRQKLQGAESLFSLMLTKKSSRQDVSSSTDTLLVIMSACHEQLRDFCVNLAGLHGHFRFALKAATFNGLLAAVADSYGASAGQQLVQTFWPPAVRAAQVRSRKSRLRPTTAPLESVERQRSVLPLKGVDGRAVVMLGGLQPDVATITVVLRKTVSEWSCIGSGDAVPTVDAPGPNQSTKVALAAWCMNAFRDLGLTAKEIQYVLEGIMDPEQREAVLRTLLDSQDFTEKDFWLSFEDIEYGE